MRTAAGRIRGEAHPGTAAREGNVWKARGTLVAARIRSLASGLGRRVPARTLLARALSLAAAGSLLGVVLSAPGTAERRRAAHPVAAPQPSAVQPAPAPADATPAATETTGTVAAPPQPPAPVPAPRPFGPPVASTPPAPPADIPGAKAYAVLESACASCHQMRPSDPNSVQGGLGNVLDIPAVERDPTLVRPGLPDASPLYQTMLARHAPLDVFRANPGKAPSVAEVETVRAWIEQVKPAPRCEDRQPITPADLATLMRKWLEEVGPEAAKTTRFLSLAHIYNSCASDAELAGYRQGAQKLINSLSWAPSLARVETVGDGTALLAFKLGEIGWVPAHWERLAAAEPQGGAVKAPAEVRAATASSMPVLRADWFAYAAGRAPLYYEMLGLPERQAELTKLAGLDITDAKSRHFIRAGVRWSPESKGPRLVERHAGREGHFAWLSYDFAPGASAAEVFDAPLEPQPGAQSRATQKPVTLRTALGLPNGMMLFAVHDASGRRIDQAGATLAGQPCMACHGGGLVPAQDEVRAHLQGERPGVTRDVRDAALAVYPGQGELTQTFEEDAYRYRRVLVQAGVDPDLTVGGLEPITALARRYERDVDLDRLAAEAGLDPGKLKARMTSLAGEARVLGARLLQGLLPRAEAERLLAALADKAGGVPPAAVSEAGGAKPRVPATVAGLGVSLWSDRAAYHVGDLISFNVQVSEDCYLTLVNVDASGKATVLFPNDFEQENLVPAGATVRIPGDSSPYQLRLKEKGQETAVAMCLAGQKLPAGIELDYERQRFPSLGLWRNFLSLNQSEEAENARNPARTKPASKPARGRTAEAKPEPAKPRSDAQGRTAIAVTIE